MEKIIEEGRTTRTQSMTSKASTVSEPIRLPSGPYWQMVYYAVAGFFFWAILLIQIPFIDQYFGGPSVIFYITFSYGLTSNIIRVVLIWYASRTTAPLHEQMRNNVYIGALMTGVSMAAFPVSMTLLGVDNGDIGFWVCIVLSGMVGLWNSLLMNAGFGLMSMAPEKSATFFLLGQSTTSVVTWPLIICLRTIVTQLGGGDRTDFIVAVCSLSFAAAVTVGTIPLYKYKTRFHPVFAHILSPTGGTPTATPPPHTVKRDASLYSVFRLMLVPAMSGWLACVITFSVYPSQVGIWKPSVQDAFYDAALYKSFLIYTFAVTDTIGRALPRLIPRIQRVSDKGFVIATVARGLVFVPLIIVSTKMQGTGSVFAEDWFRVILVVLFGVSNGTNFVLSNMLGPRRVQAADKMHAGTILSFTAINGLFIGSMIGVALKHV